MDTAPEQAVSDGDASESASDSDQNDPPSSLVADAEQYELMQIAYAAVGKDSAKRISLGRSTESSRNWRWFQRDGLWHGYPSRYKHVWTTLTGFWLDVAGKFRPPVLPPQNHFSPFTSYRSV